MKASEVEGMPPEGGPFRPDMATAPDPCHGILAEACKCMPSPKHRRTLSLRLYKMIHCLVQGTGRTDVQHCRMQLCPSAGAQPETLVV